MVTDALMVCPILRRALSFFSLPNQASLSFLITRFRVRTTLSVLLIRMVAHNVQKVYKLTLYISTEMSTYSSCRS